MESKVRLSAFSSILTLIVTVVLIAASVMLLWKGEWGGYFVAAIQIVMLIAGGVYGPLSVSADDNAVTVHSLFRSHHFPISNIAEVERFQPTMGAIRLIGSGGFMGHWGIIREGDVGKYVACYGKSSECFMLKLKNGEQYVLGCENPDAMVAYIKSRVQKLSPSSCRSSMRGM